MSVNVTLENLSEPVGFRPETLETLWSQIPPGLRTVTWNSPDIPDEFAEGFTRPAGRAPGRRFTLDFAGLPPVIAREFTWCAWQFIAIGAKVPVPTFQSLVRRLNDAFQAMPQAPVSLLERTPQWWYRTLAATRARRTGELPALSTRRAIERVLRRCYQMLWWACDEQPWWQRETWGLRLDPRIPRRPHEPQGAGRISFHSLNPFWLRRGLQWYLKVHMETGELTWSTARARRGGIGFLGDYLGQQPVPGPWLCDDAAALRAFMLDYRSHLCQLPARGGPNRGQPLSQLRITDLITDVEQFYVFMHDNQETAARALDEPGWLQLGPHHTVLWRRSDKKRPRVRPDLQYVIGNSEFSQIMANIELLGCPEGEGGLGDPQVMHVLMLLARTGRRISEIVMLDRDPLLPLNRPTPAPEDDGAFVAKLRYQQTKIDKAPDTILVDSEIVAIIRAQQQWVDEHRAADWLPGTRPKYLFLARKLNRRADRPLTVEVVRDKLTEFVAQLDIRDEAGRLVDFNRTHRFRHTKATSLLNAGVPLHVVQRYFGHMSPTMLMNYAQTLAETHEREFLRYRKITADARELSTDPRDLYDMLELDKRTDRILPNGLCLLPPRQACAKGNACLTCDKFATDATFLPELTTQQRS